MDDDDEPTEQGQGQRQLPSSTRPSPQGGDARPRAGSGGGTTKTGAEARSPRQHDGRALRHARHARGRLLDVDLHAGPHAGRPAERRFAYAVNNQTKDITIVDGTTGKSAEMIGGNGYALELLRTATVYRCRARSSARRPREDVKAAQPRWTTCGACSSQGPLVAVALAKTDGARAGRRYGQEAARLAELASPDAIVFEEDTEVGVQDQSRPPGPSAVDGSASRASSAWPGSPHVRTLPGRNGAELDFAGQW